MNSIVKQLPWKRYENGLGAFANTESGLAYYAYESLEEYFKACLEGEEHDAWVRHFSTLDEAINACNEHYSKIILDGLSPEARAILEQHLNSQNPTA